MQRLQQHRLVDMKPILRLVEDDRLGTIRDLGFDFLPAVQRQAVHEDRRGFGSSHDLARDAKRRQRHQFPRIDLLAHALVDVGIHRVGPAHGLEWIVVRIDRLARMPRQGFEPSPRLSRSGR